MRVLVTGASGNFGAYVIRALAARHELVLFARRRPSLEFATLPWIEGDLADYAACRRAVEGIDAIQHIGAQPWPTEHPALRARAEAEGIPFDATFKTNLLGTYYLMQAAVEADVQTVVMAGSNCVLGHGFRISQTPFPMAYLPMDEAHPTLPEDSYSFTKRAAEDLLASYTRAYGIRTYVTRLAGIFPEARRRQTAANAQPAQAWNPWLWAWVSSEDGAEAHRLLMEQAAQLPEHAVYFVNADDTTALEPSAELVARYQPESESLAAGMQGCESFLSCSKIKQATGWQHQKSWRGYQ